MIFKKMANYNIGKSIKNQRDNKVIAKIKNEDVSKYEFITSSNMGEMVSLEFFGKENLESQLHDETHYIPAILAAIAKAKEENREHIGEVSVIDETLGTAVVRYDDKLEEKVKELKEREKNNRKKEEEPTQNNGRQ